jgi:hypothetical protein
MADLQNYIMDLKLVKPNALSLFDAYDIPLERRKELLTTVEGILKELESSLAVLPMAVLLDKVSKPCATTEELVCVITAVTKHMLRKYTPIALS